MTASGGFFRLYLATKVEMSWRGVAHDEALPAKGKDCFAALAMTGGFTFSDSLSPSPRRQ